MANNLLGIQDVMGPLPEIKFIVEGLIPEASTTLLVGEPGAKKTWAMLSLCVSVATGNDWVGRSVTKGRVLFIDQESGRNRLLHRTRSVVLGHEVDPEDLEGLNLFTGEPFDIRSDTGRKKLGELIEEVQPVLVIIDALADIIPGADENSVKDTLPPFLWLRGVAEKMNAAIILIHHTNRSGGYRGSSAMKGNVDNLIMVESASGSKSMLFRSEKLRDSEPAKFAAEITFADGLCKLEATEINDDPFDNTQGKILAVFQKFGDMGAKGIQEHLSDGVPLSTIKWHITQLVKAKTITRKNEGDRGKEAVYGTVTSSK